MVYFDMSTIIEGESDFKSKVYQIVFEAASDTNLNVQIRNSWTLANVSFIEKERVQGDDFIG